MTNPSASRVRAIWLVVGAAVIILIVAALILAPWPKTRDTVAAVPAEPFSAADAPVAVPAEPLTAEDAADLATESLIAEDATDLSTEPLIAEVAPFVHLAVAGDVGTGEAQELRIAAAMAEVEADEEFDALLLLGDNIYPDGDPQDAQRVVFGPFANVLDDKTELIPVLGNHDVNDGYAGDQMDVLGMPAPWYSKTMGDVQIVALDSNDPGNPEQRRWLEETLAASDATWKIAIMHHPPYSGGYHGSDLDVRDAFSPLFERYGVQLVLTGHDHDYQRSRPMNGVTYIVSGGAAKLRDTGRESFTEVAVSVPNFLEIGVWETRLAVRAIDDSGGVFDELELVNADG